jgi:hypothetical protein
MRVNWFQSLGSAHGHYGPAIKMLPTLFALTIPYRSRLVLHGLRAMNFGLGSPDTFVSLPLSRRMAIVGTYEEPIPRMTLDRTDVAALNSATAMCANQIYSPAPDFVWMMRGWRIGTAAEFMLPTV